VDHSLRELGIGDMGVPKRMKKLARMFYGRVKAMRRARRRRQCCQLAEALRAQCPPGKRRMAGGGAIWPTYAGGGGRSGRPAVDRYRCWPGGIQFSEAARGET
jgi:hypothetical protein